jgi:hypothetical protein
MRRIGSRCCARTATGQAIAPPTNVMNSRRRMSAPRPRTANHIDLSRNFGRGCLTSDIGPECRSLVDSVKFKKYPKRLCGIGFSERLRLSTTFPDLGADIVFVRSVPIATKCTAAKSCPISITSSTRVASSLLKVEGDRHWRSAGAAQISPASNPACRRSTVVPE